MESYIAHSIKNRLSSVGFPLLFILLFTMYAVPVEAGGYFAHNPDDQPSIFTYGLRGLGVGTLDGMAVGYLMIHYDAANYEDWQVFMASTGIGALSGAVLGLTTGFIDLAMYAKYPNGNYVGTGAIILRDSLYGAAFGALAGTIAGGVMAILEEEGRKVPMGTAIGTLSGTALGILIGIIEGRVLTHRHNLRRRANLQLNITPVLTAKLHLVPGAGVAGTF